MIYEMNSFKLTRLIEAHHTFRSRLGLEKNFGDSYLLEKNQIYLQIRKGALESGFRYSNERNEAYSALSLSQLENILKTKTIPYLDNFSVLESLPLESNVSWDDICDNLKKNYLFHESCHALARGIFEKIATVSAPEEKILQILLEESFANTCELVAVIDAEDPIHRIFYECNAYTFLFAERTHLKRAFAEMGEAGVFRFLLLSYLQANFLRREMSGKNLERTVKLAFGKMLVDSQQVKTLKYLAKITFTLDQRFREVTTGFHLRLCGFQKPMNELLNFDVLDLLEKKSYFQNILARLAVQVFSKE